MSSVNETRTNATCESNPDENIEKDDGLDNNDSETEKCESLQSSSSKRKRKLDEDSEDLVDTCEIPKKRTEALSHAKERIEDECSTKDEVPQTDANADDISQSLESTKPQEPVSEAEAPSDIPSDLCSVRSTRNEVKTDSAKVIDNTSVVADHYNAIEEKGLSYRSQSRIFYMRNFNNWVKSMLINEYIRKIRQFSTHGMPFRVLDMCCGKGGDLLKWKKANISHLICADIADVSIKQCEIRYNEIVNQSGHDRGFTPVFTAEFITADCTKVRLREKYKDPSLQLDLVSCQFALHYSFESLPQAMCMLQNASESLKPGGYFIASLPDGHDLVHQWKKVDGDKFGNNIYNVEFCCDKKNIPLFGAKYNFHLEGVVDCPEFLVYLPLLRKLALKVGLEFVNFERFDEFYERHQPEGKSLLGKMQALETYPPYHESPLLGQNPQNYQHALQYMQDSTGHRKIGTLSLPEWEAISLYGVVAFKKMKTTWNAQGKPEYTKL